MTSDKSRSACEREISNAETVCGRDAPQAQLVGHLAGEIVRLRSAVDAAPEPRRTFLWKVAWLAWRHTPEQLLGAMFYRGGFGLLSMADSDGQWTYLGLGFYWLTKANPVCPNF